jgi:hypothetical protein
MALHLINGPFYTSSITPQNKAFMVLKRYIKDINYAVFSKKNSTILAVGPPKNPKTGYTFASEDDALAAM